MKAELHETEPVPNYADSTYFGLPNDSVSSLKVGENVRIDLYYESWFDRYHLDWMLPLEGPDEGDADYNPHDPIHWRGLPYLSRWRAPVGRAGTWNDRTSSIRVQRKDHLGNYPGAGQVVVFTEANYNEPCDPFEPVVPCDRIMKDVGEYPTTAEVGLMNDKISSIRVGPNTCVKVCSNANFQGDCDVFKESQISMSGTNVGHDRATSVQVIFPLSLCP
jgi:hypothetical protein